MVFRKIEDENAKYGVRLQNRPLSAIQTLRNETGSTQFNDSFKNSLAQDEQALKNYEQAIFNGQKQTIAFNNTMKNASAEAQLYAKSLKIVSNGTSQRLEPNAVSKFTTQQKIAEVGTIASNHSWKNSIQLINEYNSGLETQGNICKNTNLSQKELTQGISQGNKVMGGYLTGLNGAQASMGGYIKSLVTAKLASIGLQIASTALNMAITMGVSLAIQGIITLADKLITTSKEAIKAGEEAQQTISNIQKEYSDKVGLVSDKTERFAQLLRGVNEQGQNVSLSTDDYNEFLDISNQLAEAFPTLTRTYDENGNAIVKLNGDAQTITNTLNDLLDVERQIANQKIEENLDDVFDGKISEVDKINEKLKTLQAEQSTKSDALKLFNTDIKIGYEYQGTNYGEGSLLTNKQRLHLDELAKKYGIHANEYSNAADSNFTIFDTEENRKILKSEKGKHFKQELKAYFKDIKNEISNEVNDLDREIATNKNQVKQIWSGFASQMSSWLTTDSSYLGLNDEKKKNAFSYIVNNLHYGTEDLGSNVEEIKSFISEKIGSIFSNEDISTSITTFLDYQTRFNNNEISTEEFKNQIHQVTSVINNEIDDDVVKRELYFSLDIGNSGTFRTKYQNILNSFEEKINANTNSLEEYQNSLKQYQEWLDSLNSTELQIVADLQINEDTANWNLKTWKEKVESESVIEATVHFKIPEAKADLEKLTTAATESNSATGLSGDSQNNIKNLYAGTDGYDEDKLFQNTANGVKLNEKELNKLYVTQKNIQKAKFTKSIEDLRKKYNELTKQIQDTDNTQVDQINSLITQRNEIANQINTVSGLSSEYDALTSAYQEWQNAQSNGNEGDEYDSIVAGLKTTKELFNKGLKGTDDFREYIELLNGQDLSTKSVDEIVDAYNKLFEAGKSGYSPVSFLSENETGVNNFLKALDNLNYATYNSSTDTWAVNIKDADAAAKNLGISTEFLYSMIGKLNDYGFEIDIDEGNTKYALVDLEAVGKTAKQARDELNSLGGDYSVGEINFDSNDIDYLNGNIDSILRKLDKYKNKDGTINLKATGAQETLIVLQQLIDKRNALERKKTFVMKLDTSQIQNDVGVVLTKVQELYDWIDTYLAQKKINADTSEAEQNITKLITDINNLGAGDVVKDLNLQGVLNVNGKLTEGTAIKIQNQIKNIDAEMTVKAGVDKKIVDKFKSNKHDINAKIIYKTTVANKLASSYYQDKTATITYEIKTKGNKKFAVVPVKVDGTAHNSGTAFAHGTTGNWSVGNDGISLGGELGEELLIRNGHWYSIGKDSAEFFKHQKNDIIFNANQTRELFKYGKVGGGNPRGRVYNSGTAFANGSTKKQTKISGTGHTPSSNNSSSKSSSSTSSTKSNNSDTKKKTNETKKQQIELFDYIEIRIKRLERIIKKCGDIADNAAKSFATRLLHTNKTIAQTKIEIKNQTNAYKKYLAVANKYAKNVKLTKAQKAGIQNGTINITKYNQTTAEHIKKYQELYEKALDAKDAIDELKKSVSELYSTYSDIIIAKYEGGLNRIEFKESLIDTYSERAELFGYQGSSIYNNAKIKYENDKQNKLIEERVKLTQNLQKALKTGSVTYGSEQYFKMQSEIDDLTLSIAKCSNEVYKLENANRQLKWDRWDYLQQSVAKVSEEAQWFVDIMSDSKLFDDSGNYTENGMATLGLHGISYNLNMEQAASYAKEIEKINKEINSSDKNKSDINLLNRRDELIKQQRDYISSAQKEKEAIKSLVKEGINTELDALDKLIDKYNDALDSQKDLYDYQKNVKKQTEDIASLQKQLMVYSQINTDEGQLKTQQLRKSLKEAQENLQETEYNRFIADQKKMLEQMYDDYEETLNKKLDDTDQLIEDVIEAINNNSEGIDITLSALADSLGYVTSDYLQSIISGDGNVVRTYNGEDLADWNKISTIGKYMKDYYTNTEIAISEIKKTIDKMYIIYDNYANSGVQTVYNTKAVGQKASGDRFVNHNQLAWTQEKGVGEIIVRPSDNAILTPLKYGDSVLNGLATGNLFDFANNPSEFIKAHFSGNADNITPFVASSQSIQNNIDLDISLPNVQNYEQFLNQMRNDKRFAKLVEALTVDGLNGNVSSSKYKINI